jgi:hypothetical protein
MPTSRTDPDDGGPDRFLQPNEQAIFKSCVTNPPYYEGGSEYGLAHAYEAVTRHLPRAPNDPTKIRTGATLVIIFATDEAPNELKSGGSWNGKSGFLSSTYYSAYQKPGSCNPPATQQSQIASYLRPWLDLYGGKDPSYGAEAKAVVHLIGGLCSSQSGSTCTSEPELAHGYHDLVKATGGIAADICQANLSATLQLIIDSITAAASPAILEYVPISASLAVALGKQQLTRSRTQGFDYNGASNSLIFIGVPINKGDQVVASYRRWVKQAIIN